MFKKYVFRGGLINAISSSLVSRSPHVFPYTLRLVSLLLPRPRIYETTSRDNTNCLKKQNRLHCFTFLNSILFFNSILFVFSSGCSRKPNAEKISGEFNAPVLVTIEPSSPGERALFALGNRRFDTILGLNLEVSLPSLSGKFHELIQGGVLQVKESFGTLVSSNKFENGKEPELRFKKEGNLTVPRDYTSLAMTSTYFQFSTVYANLKAITGIEPLEFLSKSGKVQILFEPEINISTSEASVSVIEKLNASYIAGQKKFIIYQRSGFEKVPISQNLQVIGHEFGHALFEQVFYENKYEECDDSLSFSEQTSGKRLGSEFVMAGFNEGFADLLSFALVGSTDIMRGSFDVDSIANPRNFSQVNFKLLDTYILNESNAASKKAYDDCLGNFYCVGTLFAKSVYQAMQAENLDMKSLTKRGNYVSEVVSSLSNSLKRIAENNSTNRKKVPSVFYCPQRQSILENDAGVAEAYLQALIDGMSASRKNALCKSFKANFQFTNLQGEGNVSCT